MPNFILSVILPVSFEFSCIYILFSGFLTLSLGKNLKKALIFLLPFWIINYLQLTNTLKIQVILIFTILYVLALYLLFQQSFFDTFILYCLCYCILVILQLVLLMVFGLTSDAVHSPLMQSLGFLFVLAICVILYLYAPLADFFVTLKHKNTTFLLILGNSFLFLFGVVIFIHSDITSFFQEYFSLLFFVVLLVFLNGEVYLNHQKFLKQQHQLEAYQTYLPIIELLLEQVRERQHDYHNEIQTIRSLSYTCTTLEELKQELLGVTSYYTGFSPEHSLLKINLHLLAGFLISKIAEARNMQKTLIIDVKEFSLYSNCTEYDIIEYIGILIDNALESTSSFETIYATLTSENHQINFQIGNPGPAISAEFCKRIFSKNYTSKASSHHGIGLYKLNTFVKLNKGEISVENKTVENQIYIYFNLKI